MIERYSINGHSEQDYRLDKERSAEYSSVFSKAYYEYLKRGVLLPAQPIPAEEEIFFIGNNKLKPQHFDLRNSDKDPLGDLWYAGKSATLAFTIDRDVAFGALFDRAPRRDHHTDYLYLTSVQKLQEIGFKTYYGPTLRNPLHVRIVHDAQRTSPPDEIVPFHARSALAELLQQNKV